MKTLIVAKQISVDENLKQIIEKKISKFDKFFNDSAEAVVTLSSKRGKEILELTISMGNTLFRAEAETENFRNSLDEVMELIERQIRKNKTKIQRRLRDVTINIEPVGFDDIDEDDDDDAPKIRVKEFVIKPMSPEEAVLQMDLIGHEFFVFTNDETGLTNVVYKRKDGDYGLIVPSQD